MSIRFRRTAIPNNPPPGLMPGQLAVEMASSPPRLWCGVPYEINPAGRVLIGASAGGGFTTGDVKLTLKTVADFGWIMMDDGTIGDAQSEATTRANNDCEALFDQIWNLPWGFSVFPSRGDSAEEDWADHKHINIPRQLGRALVIAGAGAGLTNRPLGAYFGEETHAPIVAEMSQHGHAVGDPTHAHSGAVNDSNAVTAGYHPAGQSDAHGYAFNWGGSDSTAQPQAAATGAGILNNGASHPFAILQPSNAWNVMMKL